jgi:alcohol dehydrogenase class IV
VDARDRTKRTISGRDLFPAVALLDPDLTRTMPREVAIATGLDALSQAMEGVVSKKSTPVGDTLALDACRRVRLYLPRAANNPGDDEARAQMLYAALLGGCVIAQSGTTLVHGMGYHYTLTCGIAHGLANALLLAPVFAHNARYAPDKVAAIAAALGEEPSAPGPAVVAAIHRLLDELGVSPAARDHGVRPENLEPFARDVASDPYRYRNQIGDITEATILDFYSASCTGTYQLE